MLENGADLHSELLAAVLALPQADADALRAVGLDPVGRADDATVRALGPVLPDDAFEEGEGGFFVTEVGAAQDGHLRGLSLRLCMHYDIQTQACQ